MKKGSLGGLGGRRSSRNVEHHPVNWPAFMAEQMRNIPPVIGSGEASTGAVPPPLPGQLGQLSGPVDDYLRRLMATSKGPQHPFARYILSNPDQPYYDPLYQWDLQHR